MAARFNKFILVVSLFIISQSSFGGSDLTDISESAFNISLQQYDLAKENLENAIENCDRKRKTIPSSLITPLGMNIDEIKITLFVLNGRAEKICEGGARERFFYTSSIHREVSKYYGLSAGDASDYTEGLMFSQHWKKLEFEAKYLGIRKNIRKKLESIEELNIPFLIFQTIDDIEEAK